MKNGDLEFDFFIKQLGVMLFQKEISAKDVYATIMEAYGQDRGLSIEILEKALVAAKVNDIIFNKRHRMSVE